jgi:hypothetical protein
MDAALKTMFAFLQTRGIDSTGLKDASPGHRNVRKAAGTFGDRGLSVIQRPDEAATELRHLGEGMRLAALVDYLTVVASLMWSVSGSKSQPGSGVPLPAF